MPPVPLTLPTPAMVRAEIPSTPAIDAQVAACRAEIAAALTDADARLVVIVGPCSIHDPAAALEYASWLRDVTPRFEARLLVLMRAYVEKPRTRTGWKGLLADPRLDGTGRIADGVRAARDLMVRINTLGVGVATEFVGPATPAYLGDLVAWAGVGARTVESPVHREMASWLGCPVGFKNATSGAVDAAINAIVAAGTPQTVVAWDDRGSPVERRSDGNHHAHLVLRGGSRPNHDVAAVRDAVARLRIEGLPQRIMIDCSHGNSGGDPLQQSSVAADVARQIAAGSPSVLGVMIESHLRGGAQSLLPGRPLVYGQSITDACLDRDRTLDILAALFEALGPSGRRTG